MAHLMKQVRDGDKLCRNGEMIMVVDSYRVDSIDGRYTAEEYTVYHYPSKALFNLSADEIAECSYF